MILFGVDRVSEFPEYFSGRVALLTSPTGRTADNRSTIEVLKETCSLQLLLAPEHGVRGDKPAGVQFADETDEATGLPVCSLYTGTSKRLSEALLSRFDTLVYDIADVGCRYYTFISTLRYCIEDCSAAGKRLVVLDRPNPLGTRTEGGILQKETTSFVGIYDIPVRYGLTCGELSEMINEELQLHCDLKIIPCQGLEPHMTFRDWERPWILPSPNIPRYETALLYPGTCLFEGTNCSEGRGTADPFAIIGAPFVNAEDLTRAFENRHLPGIMATPIYFTPTTSKHEGRICGGVHLHIMDENVLEPVKTGVVLLDLMRSMYPDDFRFLPPARENGKPFISLLAGHREFESPDWKAEPMLERYRRESREFKERAEKFCIYGGA